MLTVVLDTNVLVSGTLRSQETPPAQILRAWLMERRFRLAVSPALMAEYRQVLTRPVLRRLSPWTDDEVERLLTHIESLADVRVPGWRVIHACRDPKDDKFLVAAVEAAADFLVTGDQDLLSLKQYEGVRIVSPAAFLERLQ